MKGSSRPAVSTVYALLPMPLQPSAGPSSHQYKLLTVWSSLLLLSLFFSTTLFIFQRKKIFVWVCFLCPSFSLPLLFTPPFSFHRHKDKGLLFLLFCTLLLLLFSLTAHNSPHFPNLAGCGTMQTALPRLIRSHFFTAKV